MHHKLKVAAATNALVISTMFTTLLPREPFCSALPQIPKQSFNVGERPSSIVAGDFNGDGALDLTTGNFENGISLLLATQEGGFLPEQRFGAGAGSRLSAGDINADGLDDLVAVGFPSFDAAVFLATRDGIFMPPRLFIPGKDERSPVLSDINLDGLLDMVTVDADSDEMLLRIGDETAIFITPQSFPTGKWPWAVAISDYNNDGLADVVTANRASNDFSFFITLGEPNQFFLPEHRTGPAPGGDVATADLNADGLLDLVTSNPETFEVAILIGTGSLTFQHHRSFIVNKFPRSPILSDLDGDRHLDLATTAYEPGGVAVFLGLGDGGFRAEKRLDPFLNTASLQLLAVDINADGLLDIAKPNNDRHEVSLLINPLSIDCNQNGILDHCDIRSGMSDDSDDNGVPNECERASFRRGDCNGDGSVTGLVTDAIFLLKFLFVGGIKPLCLAACDVDGDGNLAGVADAIYLLNFNFQGGVRPPQPFPDCGTLQPSDSVLGCNEDTIDCQH